MKPVYQTREGVSDGNCFAACVASLLERRIEDVDVDVASCGNSLRALLTKVEQKANCKIYVVSHEAIVDGIVRTSERYCRAEVCSCQSGDDPLGGESDLHAVVCEIANEGKIVLKFNPDKDDPRQKSLQQFPAVGKLFFVKAKPTTA